MPEPSSAPVIVIGVCGLKKPMLQSLPPQRIVEVGSIVSGIVIIVVFTGSIFPALSHAKYLSVVVYVIGNGAVYTGLDVVGVVPSVVKKIESTPEPAPSSAASEIEIELPSLYEAEHAPASQATVDTGAVVSSSAGVACTEPPMTSAIVLTVTPADAFDCSHVRNVFSVACVVEYVSQLLQIWWNTNGTTPPPCEIALFTDASSVAAFVSDVGWAAVSIS